MAVKIVFDSTRNVQEPTLVLGTKSGRLLGKLPAENIQFKERLNSYSELHFEVQKSSYKSKKKSFNNWNLIKDFKLVWVKEWNKWFEIHIELDESSEIKKIISAKSLGDAELSQIYLYDTHINTETDIERQDYEPSILFDEKNPNISILNRIMEKAPHYTINHIALSIKNIQRTFEFDNITIYDAFKKIAEEINCLFSIDCFTDSDGKLKREVNVYDLESYCLDCNSRGEFHDFCNECNSKNIIRGYGKDTSIFISTENLAHNISFSTDEGSVKNCFKLKAGDDLMTATIANCNPNGSSYIWHISEAIKEDMSEELKLLLDEYDEKYEYFNDNYVIEIEESALSAYNALVEIYRETNNFKTISSVIGYPALMQLYYDAIDFYLYLNNNFMPDINTETDITTQVKKINEYNWSNVAVINVKNCSLSTATNAVLAMAKTIIDSRYQVKVKDESFENNIWTGSFIVTDFSDESNNLLSNEIIVEINDDYKTFVEQKLKKALNKNKEDNIDIINLFELNETFFKDELKKYSLSNLTYFHTSCQTCLNILIEQGIADKTSDLYDKIYIDYYNKLNYIQDEILIREHEISIIKQLQTLLDEKREFIQNSLNFEAFLGVDLWKEFVSYRREDTYSNDNYVSDGLNSAELFRNALDFIDVAKNEIYKSATLQHTISSTLKNLLTIDEFKPIVDYFEIGNWLRIKIDNNIYVLRLIEYEIDFNDLDNLRIAFSDVKFVDDLRLSDLEDITNKAASLASSYNTIARQANKGQKSNEQLYDWVNKGLSLTKIKIIDDTDHQNLTWDSHGLLCKEYLPITDTYDEKQLKLINRGLYLTDDNWLTSRAAIGNFTFYNPKTQKMEESYGVIADTLIGNLVLSEKVGIYNKRNSISLDENGIIITSNTESEKNEMLFTIQKKETDEDGNTISYTPEMYIDSDGNLVLNGTIKINSSGESTFNLNDLADENRFSDKISNQIYEELHGVDGVYSSFNSKYEEIQNNMLTMFNDYKASIGQYMIFGDNGLILGASTSSFKTIIDNEGLYFKQGDTIVSYVNNKQLYIPNAVIEQSLVLGKYFVSSSDDGSISIVWND